MSVAEARAHRSPCGLMMLVARMTVVVATKAARVCVCRYISIDDVNNCAERCTTHNPVTQPNERLQCECVCWFIIKTPRARSENDSQICNHIHESMAIRHVPTLECANMWKVRAKLFTGASKWRIDRTRLMFDMCARVLHSVFGQLAHVKLDSESKKETGILYARVVFLESFRHVQIALWPIVCRLQNAYDTNAFRWLRVPAVHGRYTVRNGSGFSIPPKSACIFRTLKASEPIRAARICLYRRMVCWFCLMWCNAIVFVVKSSTHERSFEVGVCVFVCVCVRARVLYHTQPGAHDLWLYCVCVCPRVYIRNKKSAHALKHHNMIKTLTITPLHMLTHTYARTLHSNHNYTSNQKHKHTHAHTLYSRWVS